jgi:glycosyltransferase involved in cell wall biosynthesis
MLSDYLRLLLAHTPLAHAMGLNGHHKVLKSFTWKESCRKLQGVYDELLK